MALKDINADAVNRAIAECDALGREAFLKRYGFAEAKTYFLVADGKRYPSKAIAGVAHKFVEGQPLLGSSKFTGGEHSVGKKLRQLGFEVIAANRNPTWARDEIILALHAYRMFGGKVPAKDSEAILDLSALLNRLHKALGTQALETIRNANGVYLKLMNLRALDPAYTSQGKVGMTAGGKLEKVIWEEFDGRPDALAAEALRITTAISLLNELELTGSPEQQIEGEEGGVVLRVHRQRERDSKIVAAKRAWAKKAGCLRCESCDFDFARRYGPLGIGYIEVHHTKPLASLEPGSRTKLADLALLCANCHRMAHRRRVPLTLDELRAALAAAA